MMGNQIYFKIAGYVDLDVLIIFIPSQIFDIINGFWVITKNLQFDPKGHVSYCHHLASVVVVRRKLFQKSSPLKVLDQWKSNLVWIITRVSSFKFVSGVQFQLTTCLL
jgi:hypothetical protein